MSLVASILIMAGDMVEIPIAAGKKTSAKSAGPCCFALCVAHHPIRVRACRAAVGVLVVLIERIGSPEDPIAVGTRIALISLVELVLVSFPVKLALESNVTKGAPVCALRFGSAPVVALYGRRRRRGKRRNILSSCCLRRDGAHGGCRR